jgi:hypothetical protein
MRNPQNWAWSVTCLIILLARTGPYPTVAGLAETAAGLAGRALLTAGVVWLAITVLRP